MAQLKNLRIGILGGSFDPAHRGHLLISKIAIKKIRLKKIYWVVTKKNPLKTRAFYSLNERIKQAKKLTKKIKKIEVVYLDDIIKSSKSIKVIQYILEKKRPKDLYFIIGSDILLKLHKWHSWKKIVKLTKLVVFSREGYDRNSKKTVVVKYLNKNNIIFIKNRPIKVSSTLLRKRIKRQN